MSTKRTRTVTSARLRSPLPHPLGKASFLDMSRRTGLSRSTLFRQMTGRSPLTVTTVGRLAGAYGVSLTDVIELCAEVIEDAPDDTPRKARTVDPNQPTPETVIDPQAPWAVERDGNYPRPVRNNLTRNATKAERTAWNADERAADWADYRRHAASGDYIRAAAALAPHLRNSHTPTDVRTHLQAHGPFPTDTHNTTAENSVARFVKPSHI